MLIKLPILSIGIGLFTLCNLYYLSNGQLLQPGLMDLGVYNPETKKYEKTKVSTTDPNLGGDDHDYKPHIKPNLGGDDHDYKPHIKPILGGDDHDYKPHQKSILGGDEHDYKPHQKSILGGDDHDYKPHQKPNLGGDDHDYKPHQKGNLGGDDHDYKPHQKDLLGGDDHDYKPHQKANLGGDDHDYKPHQKPILGGDDHDLKPHKKPNLGKDDHDYKPHKKLLLGGDDHDYKLHQDIIGGDDHDYKPHRKPNFGEDDHDYKPHKKTIIGGDDHDYKPHKKHLLGEDDHDRKHHKKPLLGEDDHDRKPHKKLLLGGDDHDYKSHQKVIHGEHDHSHKFHKKHNFGGDDHDYRPHKKLLLGGDDHDYKLHKTLTGGKHGPKHHKTHKKQLHGGHMTKPHKAAFQDFLISFNKTYPTHKEFLKRFHIFQSNLKKIKVLQQNERGTAEYGITKFADWTMFEFRKLLGLRPDLKPSVSKMMAAEIPDIEAPVEFDWRKKGVVTPVKNQGMCGSCWAFSVTGNVEGQWALKHKHLYSLSEQELVDCDDSDQGCNGGMPENAYNAINELGGLETETGYPYEGKDDKCQLDPKKIKVQVNGSVEIPEDEEQMRRWLYKNGPISIGINANALQFYVGGVSHPFKFLCNPDNLDHGMLIVGYGIHTTKYLHHKQPFWLVKNSWGKDWGEKGYYRVFRGDGTCGVNKMATSAIVP